MTTRPKMNLTPRVRQIAGDESTGSPKAPSRQGLRAVTFYVEPDVLKAARRLVLDRDTSLQAVLSEMLTTYVRDHAKS